MPSTESKIEKKKQSKGRSPRRQSLWKDFKYGGFLLNSTRPGEISHGKTVRDVPNKKIKELSSENLSAYCSPPDCISGPHQRIASHARDEKDVSQEIPIGGITNWHEKNENAYGMITSLYEHDNITDKCVGDPIADALAVVTRKNCGILALADGVSWGRKSKLASNLGVYGAISYISKNLENCCDTKDVFRCILRSFEKAQKCIVDEEATMTTLCVGVVVPLQEKNRHAFCVVNVGDSYAYIYRKDKEVKEVTQGSHPIDELRDMRYSGGALGPADGYNPDLGNLTCSFVVLEDGDIVFLASDGISDNFDPAVAKFTPRFKAPEQTQINAKWIDQNKQKLKNSPTLQTYSPMSSFDQIEGPLTESFEDSGEIIRVGSDVPSSVNCQDQDPVSPTSSIPSIGIENTDEGGNLLETTSQVNGITKTEHDNKSLCECAHSHNLLLNNDSEKKRLERESPNRPERESPKILERESSLDSETSTHTSQQDLTIHQHLNGQTFGSHENLNDTHLSFGDHLGSSSNEEDNVSEGNQSDIISPTVEMDNEYDRYMLDNVKFPFNDESYSATINKQLQISPTNGELTENTALTSPLTTDENLLETPTNENINILDNMSTKNDDKETLACTCSNNQNKTCTESCKLCQQAKPVKRSKSNTSEKKRKSLTSCLKPSSSDYDIKSKTSENNTEYSSLNKPGSKTKLKSKSSENVNGGKIKNTFKRSKSTPAKNKLVIEDGGDVVDFGDVVDVGHIAVQTLTPRERHRGALEQMEQVLTEVEDSESINGRGICAIDVCTQIMNFVINRTAEKRAILEEVPQSTINSFTSKQRKEHRENVKKRLEDVPGKLDHASIVAFEVGQRDSNPLKVVEGYKSLLSQEEMIEARRQSEPINKINLNNEADRKILYAARY